MSFSICSKAVISKLFPKEVPKALFNVLFLSNFITEVSFTQSVDCVELVYLTELLLEIPDPNPQFT